MSTGSVTRVEKRQPAHDDEVRCPCGSGETLGACCARYLASRTNAPAPTAQALMRSRFTAFAIGDAEHLRDTWHRSTRPAELELDQEQRWLHLSVESATGGGPFDAEGTVGFTAVYRTERGRGELTELSRFVREDGRWFYVDGIVRDR